MTKAEDHARLVQALDAVHEVIAVLADFDLLKDVGDTQLGMAVYEAAERIERRLKT